MRKTTLGLIACLFFMSLTVLGQNQESDESSIKDSYSAVDLHRRIDLENDSEPIEIVMNIKNNVQRFSFSVISSVHKGNLTIGVYDPDGNKQGFYAVGTQANSKIEEQVDAKINKSLFEPKPGDWKVKIIPTEATGSIRIRSNIREY